MKELFTYNKKCNEQYIFFMLEKGLAHRKAIDCISHVLNVHYKWISIIKNEKFNPNLWQGIAMDDLFKANQYVYDQTVTLLENLDLNAKIEHEGKVKNIGQVLNHILFHSTHHRAQINILFQKFNIEIPNTDFIDFTSLELDHNF